RTWEAVRRAGAALLIIESGTLAGKEEAEIIARLPNDLPIAWVYNKIDLYPPVVSRETNPDPKQVRLMVSAFTGEGVAALCEWLLEVAGWQSEGEGVFLARARHLDALRRARDQLERAKAVASAPELFAEELRLAHRALGEITGEFTADDLLARIFAHFCIGK
ncbi:MAG TPA: tRNA uridine-5-carboxymethylaminomethyl(34) synthesis GTPase MnmE, partial [Usitatibacteraceae bacterium]|nr:tRNA uridine-5-carboxymethylaminomethyl(34) synthesis GTPase MnmE [Usitatibacteraceae bacterium]